MLLRDELANLGWAVERRLESPLEVGLETAKDVRRPRPAAGRAARGARSTASPRRCLRTGSRCMPGAGRRRAAPRSASPAARCSTSTAPRTRSRRRPRLLGTGDGRLLIREEEVPREGVVVRRSYQAARWHDGRLFVWAGNRASVGRGEASSGLAFDALEG